MNRTSGRRPLRKVLAGWLRGLLRWVPIGPGPEQTPDTNREGAGAVDAARADGARSEASSEAFQTETNQAGVGSGPPQHWVDIARSKGPPQHWLDLIRSRLGVDLSRVPWIRARALPPGDQRPSAEQLPPASEQRSAAPRPSPLKVFPAGSEAQDGQHLRKNEPLAQPAVDSQAAERRQPAAMRLYPLPAEDQKKSAFQPTPAPGEDRLTEVPPLHPETEPQPSAQARSRAASIREGHMQRRDEPPAAPSLSDRPVSAHVPTPLTPLPAQKGAPGSGPVQQAPEPSPVDQRGDRAEREQPAPQVEFWPAWQREPLAALYPASDAAAGGRQEQFEPAHPAPDDANSRHLQPVRQYQPPIGKIRTAPKTWPDLLAPGPVERSEEQNLATHPVSAERWPPLGWIEDDDLPGDEWESYQRDWQRLERLRREQQGQLWNEWPF